MSDPAGPEIGITIEIFTRGFFCDSVKWINIVEYEMINGFDSALQHLDCDDGHCNPPPWYSHVSSLNGSLGGHYTFTDNPGVGSGVFLNAIQTFFTCAFCKQDCPRRYCTMGCWRWGHTWDLAHGETMWPGTANVVVGGPVRPSDFFMRSAVTDAAFAEGFGVFQPCNAFSSSGGFAASYYNPYLP